MRVLSRDEQVDLVERSELFDMDWYTAHYWDVAGTGLHPVWHYLKYGVALGRDPGPDFETSYYLHANPDVAEVGVNPLLHYLLQGRVDGRAPTARAALDRQGAGQIERIRDCLWVQGLDAPALAALAVMSGQGQTPYVRSMAAWEQAIWHLRQGDGARTLDRITAARLGLEDKTARRQMATLEQLAYSVLGQRPEALAALDYAVQRGHVGLDAYAAQTNLEKTAGARLAKVNHVFETLGLTQLGLDVGDISAFDRLCFAGPVEQRPLDEGPKVSILVAAHNAEKTLSCALRSLQHQTWGNLEILVLDDASTDGTVALAETFARADARIAVIANAQNAGAYVMRNRGLGQATGDYVTLMDADDWAHPARIERQVAHMGAHPQTIACTSQQLRLCEDLTARRWTGRGDLITRNTASILFQRQAIMDHLGGWDEVRVSADNEMIRRMERFFGSYLVTHLETGPLTLQRDHAGSAVQDPVLGVTGVLYGARHAYRAAQLHHHARAKSLRYTGGRNFPAPAILHGDRSLDPFGITLVGDFRKDGVVLAAAVEQVALAKAAGLRVGLVHWPVYDLNIHGDMQPALRDLIDGNKVQELTYGEVATCDLMLLLDVACLQHVPRRLPRITAQAKAIVLRDGDVMPADGDVFGGQNTQWLAIGPDARELVLADPAKTLFEGEWRENAHSSEPRKDWYIAALQRLGVIQ